MYYAVMIRSDNSEVQHFGIKGRSGRYPWGSGKRPYQSAPKHETPEQREERKKRALKTAKSATEIKEFADELSYSELDQALKRIDLNRKLNEAVKKEKEQGLAKIDSAMKKVGQINAWTESGIKSIKNLNDIIDLINSIKIASKGGNYKEYKEYLRQQELARRQES